MLALIFIFLLVAQASFAQQPAPNNQYKIFVDSSGKIFVNLHQPLYFKVSSSPSANSKKYLLQSQTTPKIVNPVYLSHEGANLVYTPWAIDTATKKELYPKRNVEFIIYADGTPPKTSIKFNKKYVIYKDTAYFGKSVTFYLNAQDKLSGVENIFYSLNNNQLKQYKTGVKLTDQKAYSISYFATDHVGNKEKINHFFFVLDTSGPLTNILIKGDRKDTILSPRSLLILTSSDKISSVKNTFYCFDDEDTLIYNKPLLLNNISEGSHVLKFFAKDIVGNYGKTQKFRFYLDKTPPLILEDIIGSSYFVGNTQYLSGNSRLKLTAIDNAAGVKAIYYSFDGKNWQLYTEPIPFPKQQRMFTIKFYAVDSVNNRSQIDQSLAQKGGVFTSFIDLTPPSIYYSFKNIYKRGDTVFMNKNSKIVLWAKDNESGVKLINYQIDTSSAVQYSNPFSITNPGQHKIVATAFDNVNNFVIKEFTVKVDTTAPTIFITFSMPPTKKINGLNSYPNTLKVFISAKDNMTGVKELLTSANKGNFRTNYTMLYNFKPGLNSITIKATDFLSNTRTKKIQFYIEKF